MVRSRLRHAGFVAVVLATLSGSAQAATVLFDFETQPVDAQTPLSITAGGLNARFAGPATLDPGAFAISFNSSSGPFGAPYRTLSGGFLTTGPAFGAPGSPLTITFGAPVASISLLFALDDAANMTALALSTDTGGTASAKGVLTAGFRSPEGTLSFSGRPFTTVMLSSAALGFQIDNVSATTATAVPEPAALLLVASSLAAGLTMRGRSRR